MPLRNETIARWLLYTLATAAFCLAQPLLLRHLSLWGVFPFLYPVLPAVLADQEGPFTGTAYGLFLGVLCDLTLSGPIPCFYTLLFPLVGLLGGLIAEGLVSAGIWCALASGAAAFALVDAGRIALLALEGLSNPGGAALLAVQEMLLTLPFVVPVHLLFSAIHKKCQFGD